MSIISSVNDNSGGGMVSCIYLCLARLVPRSGHYIRKYDCCLCFFFFSLGSESTLPKTTPNKSIQNT